VRAAADVAAVVAAFAVALLVAGRSPDAGLAELGRFLLAGLVLAGLVVAVYAREGLYTSRITVLNLLELRSALECALLAGAVFLALAFVSGLYAGERTLLLAATLLATAALFLERRALAEMRARIPTVNGGGERTLVYGYGEASRLLMKKIVQAPESGRRLVGFVDDFVADGASVSFRVERSHSEPVTVPLLGRSDELVGVIREHRVTEILVSSPGLEAEALAQVERLSGDVSLRWGIAAQIGAARPDELLVESVGAIPVLRPAGQRRRPVYEAAKRLVDVVVAGLGLLLTAPLWPVLAIAIRVESPGPFLFRQERVGRDGRPFVMYKFRSLRTEADPYQSARSIPDGHVTRVGRVLRATVLDELPQLLNVLRGEMSLVGPRPEMPFLVADYTNVERRRLSVKPGVTGVWQLSPDRHGLEIHDNIEYDLFYIIHRSMLLDLVLLFETAAFAVEVVSRLGRSRARVMDAELHSKREIWMPNPDGYVLVALDQRGEERLQATWLEIAERLVDEPLPVKVLASDRNVGLLRKSMRTFAGRDHFEERVEFVPYRNRDTVRALTRKASLVITDLAHFSELARELGVEVMERRSPEAWQSRAWSVHEAGLKKPRLA
jgi:exopolysaccharide biosynthesis polyprenyl glycosylphosphotransferase